MEATVAKHREHTLIGKVYVWSIIFEPLLFFLLASNSSTGITPNPGRILQFLVWAGLLTSWTVSRDRLRVPNPTAPMYANYSMYFLLTVIAGGIGIAMGSFDLHDRYSAENASSAIAAFIRSPAVRPLFEYFITIYYFVYFVILPRYLLNSDAAIRYFFRNFTLVFVIGLILGTLDLAAAGVGMGFIPRHLADGVMVGFRFHGLAGEPRDAFVYLMFGLAMMTLREYWARGRSLGQLWTICILFAVLMTQSASGLFGLLFAGILIIAFSIRTLSPRTLALAGVLVILLIAAVIGGVYFSPRIQTYLKAFNVLFDRLNRGGPPPAVMIGQMSNIYPMWDLWQKLREGNFIQLLLGSGLGSSSVTTNNLGGFRELANPHTQIVRVLYESGVIGLYFFVMSFAAPVRKLTEHLTPDVRRRFLFLILMLVGVFLSHRSSVPFIYLGVFIVVMQRKNAQIMEQRVTVPNGAVSVA
ncbi:hypothetical protein ACFPN2_30145 [Steroidobacter flavus]|uniref:O-antigen ligase domain-containing protein n=1 Tax=Steroidobacter flavus TaxID=1842136 RepID=A0ABV8T120_9GAMM